MKTTNKSVPLTAEQNRELKRIAKSMQCVANRGRNPGPSISMLLHEVAAGRLKIVPAGPDVTGMAAPEWWPRSHGMVAWFAHRRQITIEQEIWCLRHLKESPDGLGFTAPESWVIQPEAESEEPARPGVDWWPDGEAMSRDRIQSHLGGDVDLDEWASAHGVIWNSNGWGELP